MHPEPRSRNYLQNNSNVQVCVTESATEFGTIVRRPSKKRGNDER